MLGKAATSGDKDVTFGEGRKDPKGNIEGQDIEDAADDERKKEGRCQQNEIDVEAKVEQEDTSEQKGQREEADDRRRSYRDVVVGEGGRSTIRSRDGVRKR